MDTQGKRTSTMRRMWLWPVAIAVGRLALSKRAHPCEPGWGSSMTTAVSEGRKAA
jgi:hypothetical protein